MGIIWGSGVLTSATGGDGTCNVFGGARGLTYDELGRRENVDEVDGSGCFELSVPWLVELVLPTLKTPGASLCALKPSRPTLLIKLSKLASVTLLLILGAAASGYRPYLVIDGGVGAELMLESVALLNAFCFPGDLELMGPRRSISSSLFMICSAAAFFGVLPSFGTFGISIMTGGDMSKLSSARSSATLYLGVTGRVDLVAEKYVDRDEPETN